MGWGGGYIVWLFFRQNFCLSIFSAVREMSRTFEMLTPPGTLDPRGEVGKNSFYWFSGHSWVSLTLVDWRQRKRRHYVAGFIVTSFATQRLLAEEAVSFAWASADVHYTTFVASGVVPTANSCWAYTHTIRLRTTVPLTLRNKSWLKQCANYRVRSGFVATKCCLSYNGAPWTLRNLSTI